MSGDTRCGGPRLKRKSFGKPQSFVTGAASFEAALAAAAGIVSTWLSATLGVQALAIGCTVIVFAVIAWTICLIVKSRRTFLKIMLDDGLTKEEAAREHLRRYGG